MTNGRLRLLVLRHGRAMQLAPILQTKRLLERWTAWPIGRGLVYQLAQIGFGVKRRRGAVRVFCARIIES